MMFPARSPQHIAGIIGSALILASATVAAADAPPHKHGYGTARVVVQPPLVIVELSLPATDIVGFEHPPKDEAETKLIEDAVSDLGDSIRNFDLDESGECNPSLVDVVATQFGIPTTTNDQNTESKAATAEAPKGEEPAAENAQEAPEHADFIAVHSFECKSAGALRSIGVNLLGTYASISEIEVTVTSKGSTATQTIKGDDIVIELP